MKRKPQWIVLCAVATPAGEVRAHRLMDDALPPTFVQGLLSGFGAIAAVIGGVFLVTGVTG